MIKEDKKGSTLTMTCDEYGCKCSEVFKANNFFRFIALAKRSGWTMKKDSPECLWYHRCSECSNKKENSNV